MNKYEQSIIKLKELLSQDNISQLEKLQIIQAINTIVCWIDNDDYDFLQYEYIVDDNNHVMGLDSQGEKYELNGHKELNKTIINFIQALERSEK